MKKLDFQIMDKLCEEALKEVEAYAETTLWLEQFKNLFDNISIKPNGLPSIANQNFEGEIFYYIGKFHFVYLQNLNAVNELIKNN